MPPWIGDGALFDQTVVAEFQDDGQRLLTAPRRRSLLGGMVRYLGAGHAGDTFRFPTSVEGVPLAVLECTLSIVAYSSVVRMGFEM